MRPVPPWIILPAVLISSPGLAHAQASWEEAPPDTGAQPPPPAAASPTPASEAETAPGAAATAPTTDSPAKDAATKDAAKNGAAANGATENDTAPIPSPPPPRGQRPAEIDVETTAPSAPPSTSRRVHDRFYLRGSIGVGHMAVRFTPDLLEDDRVHGRSSSFDLQLGGTPTRGLVVGGGLFLQSMRHDDLEATGASPDDDSPGEVSLFALGPFVDFYPDPQQGFHFGGTLALAGLAYDAPGTTGPAESRGAGGGAFGAWVGYDAWIAREWSLGAQLRYLGAATKNGEYDWKGATDVILLQFTALYH